MSMCKCTGADIRRYLGRISYPLLDRIDLTIEVPEVSFLDYSNKTKGKSSMELKELVLKVRERQSYRFRGTDIGFNSGISGGMIGKYCTIGQSQEKMIEKAMREWKMSMRGIHKILKVARTIADLDESENIREEHLLEAFCYKTLARNYW